MNVAKLLRTTDKDGFDVEGVTELRVPHGVYLDVLVQRKNSRVSRYFGEGFEKVYDQCHKMPNVIMYMVNRHK